MQAARMRMSNPNKYGKCADRTGTAEVHIHVSVTWISESVIYRDRDQILVDTMHDFGVIILPPIVHAIIRSATHRPIEAAAT